MVGIFFYSSGLTLPERGPALDVRNWRLKSIPAQSKTLDADPWVLK